MTQRKGYTAPLAPALIVDTNLAEDSRSLNRHVSLANDLIPARVLAFNASIQTGLKNAIRENNAHSQRSVESFGKAYRAFVKRRTNEYYTATEMAESLVGNTIEDPAYV